MGLKEENDFLHLSNTRTEGDRIQIEVHIVNKQELVHESALNEWFSNIPPWSHIRESCEAGETSCLRLQPSTPGSATTLHLYLLSIQALLILST